MIGRKEEIRVFRENFDRNFTNKKNPWLKVKSKITETSPDFYKLFLLYGDGGFGKTTLARALSDEAESIYKEKEQETKIISIDWDNFRAKDTAYRKILDSIYSELLKEKYEIDKYIKNYGEKLISLERIHKKIEDKLKEPDAVMDFGSGAVSGLRSVAGAIPGFGNTVEKVLEMEVVAGAAAKTVNYLAQAGYNKYKESIKNSKILSNEEYILWENQNESLTEALVKGIKEACKDFVILFVFDTYEIIEERLSDEFSNLFLRKLFEDNQSGITIILSGRKDVSVKFKDSFSNKILNLIPLEKLLFKEAQISEFAQLEEVQLTESEIKDLIKHTRGIPSVVREILKDIKSQAIPKEKLFADLREGRNDGNQDILAQTVHRFIKYCDPEERKKVFSLGILKEWDLELLQKLWGREVNVELTLDQLAERHSFISRSKSGTNKTFYEYLRKYLISELDESKSSTSRSLIQEYGTLISSYWEEKLKSYETKEPALDDRYNDKNFISFLKNYLNAVAFTDIHKLFSLLPGIVLESMQFNLDVCKDLLNALGEFKSPMTDKQIANLKTIQEGIEKFQWITFENAKEKTPEEVFKLVDYLEKNRLRLNDLQKTILEFRHGEIILRSGELELAFEHFEKYGKEFLNLERIRNYLVDMYLIIGRSSKKDDFEMKLLSYCIELNPKNSEAFYWRGMCYRKLKEYEKAILEITQAIDINNPKNTDKYFWVRGYIYFLLNNYSKAIQDYTKSIAEFDPKKKWGFNAYYSRAYVYIKSGMVKEAIEDYSKLIEHAPNDPIPYGYMSQILFISDHDTEAIENLNKAFSLTPPDDLERLSTFWFWTYAHIPEKREEAKVKLKESIEAHIQKYGADSSIIFWDLSPNIEKAIRDGHPEVELLKEFAKKITGKEMT